MKRIVDWALQGQTKNVVALSQALRDSGYTTALVTDGVPSTEAISTIRSARLGVITIGVPSGFSDPGILEALLEVKAAGKRSILFMDDGTTDYSAAVRQIEANISI